MIPTARLNRGSGQIIINKAINRYHKQKNKADWDDLEAARGEMAEEQTIISGISYKEIVEMVRD
ncbi:MAG: hypothetical protein U5K69_20775 [Balneolaceae bacterium]|nr:hypothetical protein [Balneolaceae bacterium]